MITPETPENEQERIAALQSYDVLDSLPEQDFDDITRIASEICDTPIALVSLVDSDRQWFKSHHGLDATETPRDVAFCAHAINNPDELLYVTDARQDERFFDNPLVVNAPNIVFYAGAVLVDPEGHALGTLCVNDNKSKELTQRQKDTLKALANQVVGQLELRKKIKDLHVANQELEEKRKALEAKNIEVEEKAAQVTEASRYKSEFLANMSHELRTPLNSLLILARMLSKNKDGNLTERQVEFASTIYDSGSDLLHLINDILDLSKVEAGRLELQLDDAPIDGIIADMQSTFKAPAEEKGLELELVTDPGLPDCLYTDSVRLNQVLKNFLSNALKFTEEGKVSLRICRPDNSMPPPVGTQIDQAVAFVVRDEGIGIPPDKQELIFNAFQQADGSTSRRFGGTGLGLSISRELAKLLGGIVHVSSEEGVGSTFAFVLPERCSIEELGEAVEADEVPLSKAEEADRPAREDALARQTILLVDDDARNIFALSSVLEDQFEVIVGRNGREAIELLQEHSQVDLVLMDIMMPEMDGYEAMRKIRAGQQYADLPIIALTANAMKGDQDLCIEAGASDYLSKPVEPAQLLSSVSEWMEEAEK